MKTTLQFDLKEQDNQQELQDINIIHTYTVQNVVSSLVLIKNNEVKIDFITYLESQKTIYNMLDYGKYWLFVVQQIKDRE